MRTSILNGLGPALRWIRDRRGKKQYQVAAAAGITKGMLSAYETGRQRPSLETLDKILDTLQCDLNDLHNSLQIVNGRPEGPLRFSGRYREGYPEGGVPSAEVAEAPPVDVYGILGIDVALPREQELALTEMLEGFHRLVRYLHAGLTRPTDPARPAGGSDEAPSEG